MIETLPTREECLVILKKSGCSENVIAHSKAVETHAVRIAVLAMADKDLVSRGALLHDIGRGKTHGIEHAVVGGEMAKELGLPESIIHIIERHIGAGLNSDEAAKLGLPRKDYIPLALEEKIVAHADNLVGEHTIRPVSQVVSLLIERGYDEVAQKIMALHKELGHICGIDLDTI
jgi:uncharacterized protein (TIGR00295 family)